MKEHDVVLLRGTIVHIFKGKGGDQDAYAIEIIGSDGEVVTVVADQVRSIPIFGSYEE